MAPPLRGEVLRAAAEAPDRSRRSAPCSTPSGRVTIERDGERHGGAGGVAHERREVHLLARAIDAALGIEVAVERARGRAALHAAVGEIEGVGCADRGRRIRRRRFRRRGSRAQGRLRRASGRHRSGRSRCRRSWRGSTSLLRAISRTLASAIGRSIASERTKACTPSSPENAVRPMSETMNHCVASAVAVLLLRLRRARDHGVGAGLQVAEASLTGKAVVTSALSLEGRRARPS